MPYRSIEDPVKLRRVLEATLLLESDLDLPSVLRHVIEEARSMTNARYGALGVLDADRIGLERFITSGLDPEEERAIGARPKGKGLLGLLITDPKPVRIASLGEHPDSYGFPHNHPPMDSFLGIPVMARGEVYGNLYLTDKIGWSEFTADDEALVGALAVAAGIAIENARLHEQATTTAVRADRDRLARDLHDSVIQRLFGVGLTVQSIAGGDLSPEMAARLNGAVKDIDETIRQIRTTIFELGLADIREGARSSILSQIDDLKSVVGFRIDTSFDGPIDTACSDLVVEQLLLTLREAVSNVERHAHASRVDIAVSAREGRLLLRVADDGRGMDLHRSTDGNGMANMRHRAEKLRGTFEIECPSQGGTVLSWRVLLD